MQSRRMSLVEAVLSTAIGFAVSYVLGMIVYPLLGWHVTPGQNVIVVTVFTVASIIRGYGVRRLFNWLGLRK